MQRGFTARCAAEFSSALAVMLPSVNCLHMLQVMCDQAGGGSIAGAATQNNRAYTLHGCRTRCACADSCLFVQLKDTGAACSSNLACTSTGTCSATGTCTCPTPTRCALGSTLNCVFRCLLCCNTRQDCRLCIAYVACMRVHTSSKRCACVCGSLDDVFAHAGAPIHVRSATSAVQALAMCARCALRFVVTYDRYHAR